MCFLNVNTIIYYVYIIINYHIIYIILYWLLIVYVKKNVWYLNCWKIKVPIKKRVCVLFRVAFNVNATWFCSHLSLSASELNKDDPAVTRSVSVGSEHSREKKKNKFLGVIFIKGLNMCGIWALFGIDVHSISKYDKTFSKIQHRGPDAWRLEYDLKVKVIIE